MQRFKLMLVCTAAGSILTACTQGATGPPSFSSVNPITNSKLQMAVGTANIFGTGPWLNVASTMRQPNGDSAVLVDTPALTGPFTLPGASGAGGGVDAFSTLPGGPSLQEVAVGGTLSGTSQFVRPGTPVCDSNVACGGVPPNTTTFGQSGGVFGMGIAPYNSNNSGTASSYSPYNIPVFDTSVNSFTPWGGPPAFDPNGDHMGVRDGNFNIAKILGIAMGITPFKGVKPALGNYNLTVTIPTSPTSSGTVSASAALTTTAMLGTAPKFTLANIVLDGAGGGTFTVAAFPAGVTEGYVEIIDTGNGAFNCQGSTGPAAGLNVYYTIHVTSAGAATLPDKDGPNFVPKGQSTGTGASPSICTAAQNLAAGGVNVGDSFSAYFIGMDYPLYAASYPASFGNQAPTIAGANGQADITISLPFNGTSAAGVYHNVRTDSVPRHRLLPRVIHRH